MASQYGKLVNKQFNSPINLYSENNIRDVLDRETQMLSNGAVGINFHNPTSNKPGNLQNSAVLRFLEEEEQRKKGGTASLKRVAWPPASDAEGHLSEISQQDLDGPQIPSVGLQNNQSPSANNYQQSVTSPTYQPTPISPNYRPLSPKPNVSPMRYSPVPPGKQWAPVHSPIANYQTKPPSFTSPQTYSPQQYSEESLQSQQYQVQEKQQQFVQQNYQPVQPIYQPVQQNYQPVQPNYQPVQPNYQPVQQNYQPVQPNYQPVQPNYQPVQQNYQPVDNAQPRSPQVTQQQQPAPNYGTPQQQQQYHQQPPHRPAPVVEPPPATIRLRQETPVSQIPASVYTSQPATATLKGGKNLRGDLKWPPPETKAQMEVENQARVDLARGPVCRPRKVNRDYSGFFAQHALNSTYPGYKIPPGTQFYAQERMS